MKRKNILFINSSPKRLSEDSSLVLRMLEKRYDVTTILKDNQKVILPLFEAQVHRHDIVIFDHNTRHGIDIFEKMLAIAPKANYITLTSSIYCSDPRGCDHCMRHYRKVRILKPLRKKELFFAIEHFNKAECFYRDLCEPPPKHSFLYA